MLRKLLKVTVNTTPERVRGEVIEYLIIRVGI
jgi:hypothetical protein